MPLENYRSPCFFPVSDNRSEISTIKNERRPPVLTDGDKDLTFGDIPVPIDHAIHWKTL
jgi:hypothetical protein